MSDAIAVSGEDEPAWVSEVFGFWFSELAEADWFRKSDAVDALIRERFLGLHGALLAGGVADAAPRVTRAAIIVFDQFSRNMFRGTARAFAADPLALQLARSAVAKGVDAGVTKNERLFLYMPFEHSENAADQALSVDLIATLDSAELMRYAIAHRDIITRFGRFPHRNAMLGRISTPEELEFLTQPGSAF